MFQIDVPGTSVGGLVLKPWDQRTRNATELQTAVQAELNKIAGAQVVAFQPPTLPGASGLPVQFAITTTGPFEQLNRSPSSCWPRPRRAACSPSWRRT